MNNQDIQFELDTIELKGAQLFAYDVEDLEYIFNERLNSDCDGEVEEFKENDDSCLYDCEQKISRWFDEHDNQETPLILDLFNHKDASEMFVFLDDVTREQLDDYLNKNGKNSIAINMIMDLKEKYLENVLYND